MVYTSCVERSYEIKESYPYMLQGYTQMLKTQFKVFYCFHIKTLVLVELYCNNAFLSFFLYSSSIFIFSK